MEKTKWLKAISVRKNKVKILALVTFCFGLLRGQNLDYNGFLSHVKQYNPISEKAENNKEIAAAQYKSALGNYDPQISASVDNKFFNKTHYYTTGFAEIKQPLFASNYLKAGYLYGQGININPENYTPSSGQPFAGIETNVLQGLFFDKRRADILKARYYSDYYSSEQKIQLNDLLHFATNAYVNFLYVAKQNSLYAYFAELALQRAQGIETLALSGERASVDTVEASIFFQARILERQASEAELIKEYNSLLAIYKGKSEESIVGLIPRDSLDAVFELFLKRSRDEISKVPGNPILEQYHAKQGLLETETRFRKELIKPQLNVSYNLLGTVDARTNVILNQNNYKWGASFAFPLFLRKQRFDYKLARIATRNNSLELINKTNELNYKQRYMVETLKITEQQVINAKKAAAFSRVLVEAEKLKFQNGESSLFLLNTREAKWLETELKQLEYKLKYIKLMLDLIYLNGTLEYELI